MANWVLAVVGVVLLAVGVLWALQGFNVVGGSFMSGNSTFAVIGPVVAVVGLLLAVVGLRAARDRRLSRYGFRFRNLHRIELETLATNAAMRKLAESCGFVLEGIQRERAYDGDGFSDIVLYGLLRQEWRR